MVSRPNCLELPPESANGPVQLLDIALLGHAIKHH
jgi:hypothetical protein